MPEDDPDPLRYTDRKDWLVAQARGKGLSDEQIIRRLTEGRQWSEVKEIALVWCDFLGMPCGDFLKIARPYGPGRR